MSEEAALVRVAWVPGRAEPDRRAEMTTQWLSGEALSVVEEGSDRWLRVRDAGGYGAWVDGGGLVRTSPEEAERWRERAAAWSMGTDLAPAPGERAGPPPPRWLPWGARAVPEGDGRLEVAGGARVMPVEPAAVVTDRADRFPRTAGAVVRTARRWLGVPYLWGGRTREGVDCSGLVQAVLAAHRIDLPRDSGDQRAALVGAEGERAAGDRDAADAGPDDDGAGTPSLEGEPGELLFFGPEGGGTDHVAFRVGGSRILHAAAGNGQVAEDDLAGDGAMGRHLRERFRAAARPLEEAEAGG